METAHDMHRGQIKLYRGQAIRTTDGKECWFSRKSLEAIDIYHAGEVDPAEDVVIAEALDGSQYQCDGPSWRESREAA